MKRLAAGLAVALTATLLIVQSPALAATHKGRITAPFNYFYLATGEEEVHGPLGITMQAFLAACRADRLAIANGQAAQAGNVGRFLSSPLNGWDGYVVDLKAEKTGAFAVKGPGAKAFGPEVSGIQHTDYDMDLGFYADTATDATAAKADCADANKVPGGNRSHRCFAAKETPDEKTGCIVGYKDAKGKVHGARYVVVNAVLQLKGAGFDITLTTP